MVMKKWVLMIACACGAMAIAEAQVGSLLQKAAKKAVDKTTEKVLDKTTDAAAEAASKAVERQVEKVLPSASSKSNAASSSASASNTSDASGSDAPATYESYMRQLPELPTAQQLVNYKNAELNEQKLKMLGSPVFTFSGNAAMLAMQVLQLPYEDMDSAQLTNAAYKYAEAYTGLSKEEIDKLSAMTDEEKEAYLASHYQKGRAETTLLKNSEEVAKYLEPLQPQIDRWDAFNDKVEELYRESDAKCKTIYGKYADRLASASEAESRDLQIRYYSEIVPIQRQAVEKALQIRLNEQLPVAEAIEKEMVKIRATHQDAVSMLLNYPQLTATRYFAEVTRLLNIPRFDE